YLIQLTACASPQDGQQIGFQPRQQGLGFGISKSCVELEDIWLTAGDHKPDVQNAGIAQFLRCKGLIQNFENARFDGLSMLVVKSDRRVGAHSTCVGSSVTVKTSFVVLQCRHGDKSSSI